MLAIGRFHNSVEIGAGRPHYWKRRKETDPKGRATTTTTTTTSADFLDIIEPVFDEDCGCWPGSSLSLRLRG
jgi:hypothetical protein